VNRHDEQVGVGVIGLGVGRNHVASISQHSQAQVRFICDLDESRCNEVLPLAPQAEVTDQWRDVILSSAVDLVVVASPDHLHAEMTEFAIKNSKHVFVEKPICITSNELTRLVSALRDNSNCLLSSNMVLRANPVLIDLRREMIRGALGKVSHIEASYLYGRFNKIVRGWRGQSSSYSAILGGGIHMLDLVMWLVNERPVSVFGIGHSLASISRGHPIDDLELAVIKFESGLTATITAVLASSVIHSHSATVHGTDRTFVMDMFGYQYVTSESPAGMYPKPLPQAYQRSSVLLSFVDKTLGKGQSLVDTVDVIDCVAVALAIRKSIMTGAEVNIDYW